MLDIWSWLPQVDRDAERHEREYSHPLRVFLREVKETAPSRVLRACEKLQGSIREDQKATVSATNDALARRLSTQQHARKPRLRELDGVGLASMCKGSSDVRRRVLHYDVACAGSQLRERGEIDPCIS
jgi:hypothetical protein